jgi:hypothetical protein
MLSFESCARAERKLWLPSRLGKVQVVCPNALSAGAAYYATSSGVKLQLQHDWRRKKPLRPGSFAVVKSLNPARSIVVFGSRFDPPHR